MAGDWTFKDLMDWAQKYAAIAQQKGTAMAGDFATSVQDLPNVPGRLYAEAQRVAPVYGQTLRDLIGVISKVPGNYADAARQAPASTDAVRGMYRQNIRTLQDPRRPQGR